jgi:hypothetical protein
MKPRTSGKPDTGPPGAYGRALGKAGTLPRREQAARKCYHKVQREPRAKPLGLTAISAALPASDWTRLRETLVLKEVQPWPR